MNNWEALLRFDPLPPLLFSRNAALCYFVRRDLLEENAGPVSQLWELPTVMKLLSRQQPDGSWSRVGRNKHPAINPSLVETWRYLRILVEQYGLTREHPGVSRAAEYLFDCQAEQGDMRGMLANQYATYYTGAILATLIQAGYVDDPRIEKGLQWLLGMRQSDQGWTIPLLTHKFNRAFQYRLTSQYAEPVEPDRSKPFSHNWTGMVLRAFAAHPAYRKSEAAYTAANLLKSRFFQPDAYTSYRSPDYWVRFEYPFWWNNLVSALDSLTLIGISKDDKSMRQALNWLVGHQQADGLWQVSYMESRPRGREMPKAREMGMWVSLAICRVFKRQLG